MTEAGRKVVIGTTLVLVTGGLIGWRYGFAERGLLVAALVALLWQLRNLLAFDRALHTGDFTSFRYGEGIWQQLFSRFRYERERGSRYKRQQLRLLKEIRKSTNAMPDGAVILDQQNEIVTSNRAAKLLSGLKPRKDRGRPVDNIIRDPVLVELLRSDDATRTVDIRSPVDDNAWLNCRVVPYGAGQKLLLIRDVTERIRLSKMRRDFVANASHELRSPLTVICGYLDSLAEDSMVPVELRPPMTQMQRQARRMTIIVDELMQLSRIESSGPAAAEELVDVAAMLTATADMYAGLDKSPTIDVLLESSAQILGVGTEIESVIGNLVSNAVRHTAADGRISLLWRAAENGGELIVGDNGEGIAAEHIPRLTERFFRVDRGRARDDGGIGLGLAIVKHVLQRHDAKLVISSVPGQGSEFRCYFPAARVSAGS
jgi:two-component system phosphate regulon sensor histidine kinase PhoR